MIPIRWWYTCTGMRMFCYQYNWLIRKDDGWVALTNQHYLTRGRQGVCPATVWFVNFTNWNKYGKLVVDCISSNAHPIYRDKDGKKINHRQKLCGLVWQDTSPFYSWKYLNQSSVFIHYPIIVHKNTRKLTANHAKKK